MRGSFTEDAGPRAPLTCLPHLTGLGQGGPPRTALRHQPAAEEGPGRAPPRHRARPGQRGHPGPQWGGGPTTPHVPCHDRSQGRCPLPWWPSPGPHLHSQGSGLRPAPVHPAGAPGIWAEGGQPGAGFSLQSSHPQHGEEVSPAASDLAMVLTRGLSLEHQKSSRDSLQYSSGYSTQTTTPSCSEDTIPSQGTRQPGVPRAPPAGSRAAPGANSGAGNNKAIWARSLSLLRSMAASVASVLTLVFHVGH